jgi:hypothetical protein
VLVQQGAVPGVSICPFVIVKQVKLALLVQSFTSTSKARFTSTKLYQYKRTITDSWGGSVWSVWEDAELGQLDAGECAKTAGG